MRHFHIFRRYALFRLYLWHIGDAVSSLPPAHWGCRLVFTSGTLGMPSRLYLRSTEEVPPHPPRFARHLPLHRGRLWQRSAVSPAGEAGTSGMVRAFPYEGKVVLCFSGKSKEPDEVEQRVSAEVYRTNGIRRGSPHKRYPPRYAAATQNIGYPPSLPAGAATPCHLNSPPRFACLSACSPRIRPKNRKKGTEKKHSVPSSFSWLRFQRSYRRR